MRCEGSNLITDGEDQQCSQDARWSISWSPYAASDITLSCTPHLIEMLEDEAAFMDDDEYRIVSIN